MRLRSTRTGALSPIQIVSTIQMMVALKPIKDAVGIARINVATYQAVSGTGKEAIDELAAQTRALFNQQDVVTEVYPKRIAFNVLPQIDVFMENGYTKEEMKMVWETQKIMEDDSIQVNPTAVRVPVFYGHSEAVHIETLKKITANEARALFGEVTRRRWCWMSMSPAATPHLLMLLVTMPRMLDVFVKISRIL